MSNRHDSLHEIWVPVCRKLRNGFPHEIQMKPCVYIESSLFSFAVFHIFFFFRIFLRGKAVCVCWWRMAAAAKIVTVCSFVPERERDEKLTVSLPIWGREGEMEKEVFHTSDKLFSAPSFMGGRGGPILRLEKGVSLSEIEALLILAMTWTQRMKCPRKRTPCFFKSA